MPYAVRIARTGTPFSAERLHRQSDTYEYRDQRFKKRMGVVRDEKRGRQPKIRHSG